LAALAVLPECFSPTHKISLFRIDTICYFLGFVIFCSGTDDLGGLSFHTHSVLLRTGIDAPSGVID
jgi:hypothetical protein